MKTKFINAVDTEGKPVQYISQIAELKPEDLFNVALNKVTTGSGFTSYILESNLPYVICVPHKPMIESKLQWCKEKSIDCIGVYGVSAGGATDKDIADFKGNKIFVTWDSLKRLVIALGDKMFDYHIALDEAHCLVNKGGFRPDAIYDVIELHTKFKSFVLGTATPIDVKYNHSVFSEVKQLHIKWHNLRPVNVNYSVCEKKDLYNRAAMIAMNHIAGITKGNCHIFINSVVGVARILKLIANSPFFDKNMVRIIAAKDDRNKEIFRRLKLTNIKVNTVVDPVKILNFYTSTYWEGGDVIDSNTLGRTYIISDGHLDHTKVNVSVQLPQIIGRVRNSQYKNKIELLYCPNKYNSCVTKEEFENEVLKEIDLTNLKIDTYKIKVKAVKELGFETDDITRDFTLQNECNPFITLRNNEFILNELGYKNEMNNFDTIRKTYYVPIASREVIEIKGKRVVRTEYVKGIDKVIEHNDITYNYIAEEAKPIEGLSKKLVTGKVLFSDLCKEYFQLKEETYILTDRIKIIDSIEPIIKEAFDKLGKDKMIALECRKNEFKKELIKQDKLKVNSWKVSKLLNYKSGQWISTANIKVRLQEVYNELNINQTATASALSNYYNVLAHKKRINSVPIAGFTIVLEKYR
tara:strand:+ start:4517 stop:6427 length:1911 start_codon:yes stop_codon:yes gene_type:complete